MARGEGIDPLTIDVGQPETALRILRSVKHTRLEGMIVEHEVAQTLHPTLVGGGWQVIDAMVLRRLRKDRETEFLILPRPEAPHEPVQALAEALRSTGNPVRSLSVRSGVLLVHHSEKGVKLERPMMFSQPTGAGSAQPQPHTVRSPETTDRERMLAVFWGIGRHLGPRFETFLRELLIKDHCVTPVSRALWDLDSFLISPSGQILYLEVKHKYPMKSLRFGMNIGEVEAARMLGKAGLLTWHVILVKPRWDARHSSMYLFFDRRARERALWIAGDMQREGFFTKNERIAAAKTSLYGGGGVRYKELQLSGFCLLGSNAEPSDAIGRKLLSAIEGEGLPVVTGEVLTNARIP